MPSRCILWLGTVLTSTSVLSCGGNNGVTTGATCDELCPAIAQCDPDSSEATGCESSCGNQRMAFNQAAWDAYTGCVMQDSCVSLSDCLQEAVQASSPAPVNRFLDGICDWAVKCEPALSSRAECRNLLESIGQDDEDAEEGSPWDFVRLIDDSTLDCMLGCVRGLGCGEMDFGGASQECLSGCGFSSLSGDDDSGFSSGNFCEEDHGDCGSFGTITENEFGGCECVCDEGYFSLDWVCQPGCTLSGCGANGSCDADFGTCNCGEGYYWAPESGTNECQPLPYFVDFGLTERATCALRHDGRIECWGDDIGGGLEPAPPDPRYVSLSVGGSLLDVTGCAIRDDGSVECWGDLGSPGVPLTQLSIGEDGACGIQPTGELFCWGRDPYGLTMPPETTGFVEVVVGPQVACGVRPEGGVSCWGLEGTVRAVPEDLVDVRAVALGGYSGCALMNGGSVRCFGSGAYASVEVPAPNEGFVDIACSEDQACGIRSDGTLACWGRGNEPPQVLSGRTFTDIEAGPEHLCAMQDDGVLRCWGRSSFGEAPATRSAER